MRFDNIEKNALKKALNDFNGKIFLFGSRIDDTKKGGDIDILLIPNKKYNPLNLSLEIQKKFYYECEQTIDIVIYNESLFCKEVLKNAKRIDIAKI
jgi:uncharacterized protein